VPLIVVVTNESDFTWPAGSATRLGNHWQSAQEETLTLDDGRTSIVALDVDPGGSVTVKLVVTVPEQPGHYRLELDVVEEGVTWFAVQGSVVLRLPVHVEGTRPSLRDRLAWRRGRVADASVTSDETEPEPFSMNAVTRHEVEALVIGAGGSGLHVEPSGSAGPDWEAYRYVVTRD
jgi:hypothetical protein